MPRVHPRPAAALLFGRQARLRWAHLVLGGALAMPYFLLTLVLGDFIAEGPGRTAAANLPAEILCFLASLPLAAITGALVPAVRVLEGSAARVLLGGPFADMPTGDPHAAGARGRTAAWFTLHLGLGGLMSGLTLAAPPFAFAEIISPVLSAERRNSFPWLGDIPADWGPAVGVALLAVVVFGNFGAGQVLARCVAGLLGPTPAEALADQLAESEQRALRLGERNRIARELHDSVGHALSVVTLQAGAAGRVLDRDPDFVRQALTAIEESARGALEELDQVLGLLRDESAERPSRLPRPDLGRLDQLLSSARAVGTEVAVDVTGELAGLPPEVSCEAYRIVQEGLTNSLRHGGRVPVLLELRAGEGELEVEMVNPATTPQPRSPGGGRGLPGIRERVAALGGTVTAGREGDQWRLLVRLPLRPRRPSAPGK